jgi:hypothetical protein
LKEIQENFIGFFWKKFKSNLPYDLTLSWENNWTMEATHEADWKATYIYVYVRSLYLYVNLVTFKSALPCLIILWDDTT